MRQCSQLSNETIPATKAAVNRPKAEKGMSLRKHKKLIVHFDYYNSSKVKGSGLLRG